MSNPWITRAEELAETRHRALVVDLPAALATANHDAALTAMTTAADADGWFAAEDVVSHW
ncbi:hypothetical protein [Streptomyces sp. LN500]|uniref:hypothetical protein n=1 Tax=Streptomyces sp. LN500 TaxID=3112978 RepID=UPI00371A61C7